MHIPRSVRSFASIFNSHGFECYLVGGAIRDLLKGRLHADWDIATDARPEQVMAMFRRVIPTGIKHGTVTVFYQDTRFEVTTFRIESRYSDGRRPDSVTFAPSITEDLSRRDFTMNAIAYNLATGEILDPHGGRKDLARGIIRAIGDPDARFHEDGLRPLRACRFAAQFSFTVEETTLSAISRALDVAAGVSMERVRDEITKIIESPSPSTGFLLMLKTGLLRLFLPELVAGQNVKQGELHCFDVLTHSLKACDAAPASPLIVRLAALFHDVGKPLTRVVDAEKGITFYTHEKIGAEMTGDILRRLRFPTALIDRVTHLIAHHMFNYQEEWSDAAVRRLIARVGEQNIEDLISLRRADHAGMCDEYAKSYPESLVRFAERVEEVREGQKAFTVKQLAVNGNDLMESLGLSSGPTVGTILTELLGAVLEDPELNERDRLIQIAKKLYRERISPGASGLSEG